VCAVVGSQQWSGPRSVPADCTPTTYMVTTNPPATAYYSSTGLYPGSGYLYNWKCVNEHAEKLCPSPWRVPTRDDFCDLDKELFSTSTCTNRNGTPSVYVTAWGGVYGGSVSGSSVGYPGSDANYWSSTVSSNTYAYRLLFSTGGTIQPQGTQTKNRGLQVRCVKY
jgi:uncharacterized protein (TIGR02145 family)